MSMLAEPRRKQKIINLRAKNNEWSNDANKFGQRMLEKMGWSSGKGLGAKENGITEHVIAKYKNDDKGLGYEDKNDQWTKHEDDFNALLANLSNGKDEKKDVLHSGISLEVKSKKSKARIHYHKFTRGKDLSKYSEKDLANIFGKKSFKEEVVDKKDKEEIISTEQVFTEKGSMEDYFKAKMGALKFKNKIDISDNQDSNKNQDFVFEGFSFTKEDENHTVSEKKEMFSFYSSENNKIQEITVKEYKQEKIPKKTKKKKSKIDKVTDHEIRENTDHVFEGFSCINTSECTEALSYDTQNKQTQELPTQEPVLTKKNKKKKKNKETADTQECTFENVDTKKTKKRNKDKTIENTADCSEEKAPEECGIEETYVPKKKKKRKNKDL